ncbi:MAG: hypothetical protein M0P57_09230 [Syntrophales bacterium]|jgi:hypothetical protein|nr:hypothetical protein [Syntrophales bacterium]MDY0044573.1 hypothetical protein [Syntrophales bacterium]
MIPRLIAIAACLLIFYGCGSADGDPVTVTAGETSVLFTAHTFRLPADTPEVQAVAVSQAVYSAIHEDTSPNAVIICPQDAALAFTAMNRITHMPVNAPLFYLDSKGEVGSTTMDEIRRIKPAGVTEDGQVQAYLVGEVSPTVADTLRERLNLDIREFRESDPVKLALLLDRWQAALKSDHPDEVVISALDHPDGITHGMGEMGWNAHMGRGFAWVLTDSVPDETRRILEMRYGEDGAYMYLTGGPDVISDKVAVELSRWGQVRRVFGDDVYHSSAVNAGYKDFGRNFGWWWGWESRNFDWGISQAGHNFIIGNPDNLLGLIPAVLLGHMGKHGPVLLVKKDEVPKSVADYLRMVKPFAAGPTATILNHGIIIGDVESVSWKTQVEIDRLLRPRGMRDKSGEPLPQAPIEKWPKPETTGYEVAVN